jgi:glutaconate CoA-transferase subunit B
MAKKKLTYDYQEQLCAIMAREFTPEDEVGATAIFNHAFVALGLAQELYAPGLAICVNARGRWAMLGHLRTPFEVGKPPEPQIEALMDHDDIFDCLQGGRWNIFMQPAQIDKFGNMNISMIGADKKKPKAALVGSRGVPDNTTNGGRIYYNVADHNVRSFAAKVDFVSGCGHTGARKEGLIKYGHPKKVFSNLGVFDFDKKTGCMRVVSLNIGVTKKQVVDNTGFELIWPDPVPESPAPTEEELMYIREIVDPAGIRRADFAKGEELTKIMAELWQGMSYEMIYGK